MRTLLMHGCVWLLALAALAPSAAARDTLSKLKREYARAQAMGDAEAVKDALERMGALDDKKAASMLLKLAMHPKADDATVAGAKLGLAALTDERGIADLAKLCLGRRGTWEAKALVAEAFASVGSDKARETLITLLEDENAVVRRLAAASLTHHPHASTLKALAAMYERLEGDLGRDFYACRRALIDLTGFAYARGEDWIAFAQERADTFDFENDKGREVEGATISTAKAKAMQAQFFGSEIRSSRVVFVIDTSGSMVMWDENGEFREQDYKDKRAPEARQRMHRTKEELKKVISSLQDYVLFNVVSFSSATRRWQQELVPATESNKEKARTFVDRLRADGGTHTGDALEDAFKFEECDTIYLLTDGAPEKFGEEKLDAKYREEILTKTKTLNRHRRVRVHCLGFTGVGVWPKEEGVRPDSLDPSKTGDCVSFLRRLAEQNAGDFKEIP